MNVRCRPLNKNDLVVVISQSGETADTLAALREAKSQNIHTLAMVNVVGSSAREADNVSILAGPKKLLLQQQRHIVRS